MILVFWWMLTRKYDKMLQTFMRGYTLYYHPEPTFMSNKKFDYTESFADTKWLLLVYFMWFLAAVILIALIRNIIVSVAICTLYAAFLVSKNFFVGRSLKLSVELDEKYAKDISDYRYVDNDTYIKNVYQDKTMYEAYRMSKIYVVYLNALLVVLSILIACLF